MKAVKFFNSNLFGALSFVALFLSLFYVISGKHYLIAGNLHDLWIPQLNAYAVKTGMSLHENFHTSFGLIYSFNNYLALLIIETFPALFTRSDLILLSSCTFSLAIITLFLLGRRFSKGNLFNWFSLILILSITFQVRDISKPFDADDLLWYGVYNNHLWAVLLLQIISVLDRFLYLKDKKEEELDKNFLGFLFFQFLCTFIAFNYKINFFMSSVAIASSIFFALSNKKKIFYLFLPGVLYIIGITGISLLFDYSYKSYFQDVFQAVESKKPLNPAYLIGLVVFFFLLFELLNRGVMMQKVKIFEEYKKLRLYLLDKFNKMKELVTSSQDLTYLYFCFSISIGVFLGIIGDWQRPAFYYILVLGLFSISLSFYKSLFKFVIVSFVLVNYFSLIRMGSYNHKENHNKMISTLKIPKYTTVSVVEDKPDFLLKNYVGTFDLIEFFEKKEDDVDFFLKLSSSYKPVRRHWGLYYANLEYKMMLDDAKKVIEKAGYDQDDDLIMLEFVNPLPIIFGTRIPDGSYHWVHIGTTFSYDNLDKLYSLYREAEIMYIPSLTTDGDEQTYLNCSFYEWNRENGRFDLYSASPQGMLFLSKDKAAKSSGFEKPLPYTASMVKRNCDEILNTEYN